MDNTSINNRFRSILYVLTHFSCSLVQLACVLGILGLQITLTITQTCAFRIGAGFWSFPFLLLSPISIWIILWKRNTFFCFLTFTIHICSTLFATTVIIISFLALIGQIGSPCLSSSTTNNYFFPINISLISVSIFLKIFIYAEIFLVYMLKHHKNEPSVLLDKQFYDQNYQIISVNTNIKSRSSFKSIINKNPTNISDLDV
jgi:hypothetical protein